uniref:BPTI/Kunitz inhibitor domain-containing protein n=1 Tax=Equus asinus TaxID=9793 RepID=A0A8C4N6I3_EQUAS
MKPEWIYFSLCLLIFSMPLDTLAGFLFPTKVRDELCDSGHLGDICNYPPKYGICKLTLTRFYYNTLTFVCEPFTFSGCGGNRNNFKHKYICENFCVSEK